MNQQKLKQIQDEINRIFGSNLYANILAFWKFDVYEYFTVGVWSNKDQTLNCISDYEEGGNICQIIFKFDEDKIIAAINPFAN